MDLRKRRSQEKLQVALAHHLQSKTIDEITIGELTRTAGVSRQTFYSNFDSKQSILLTRIEAMIARSKTNIESFQDNPDLGREEVVERGFRFLLEECDKDRNMMRAAFTGQAGIQCLTFLKAAMSSIITARVKFLFGRAINQAQMDTISDFYAGALIGTIQGWLTAEPGTKDMDALVTSVGQLIPHGMDAFYEQGQQAIKPVHLKEAVS